MLKPYRFDLTAATEEDREKTLEELNRLCYMELETHRDPKHPFVFTFCFDDDWDPETGVVLPAGCTVQRLE